MDERPRGLGTGSGRYVQEAAREAGRAVSSCPDCGAPVKPDAGYSTKCGAALSGAPRRARSHWIAAAVVMVVAAVVVLAVVVVSGRGNGSQSPVASSDSAVSQSWSHARPVNRRPARGGCPPRAGPRSPREPRTLWRRWILLMPSTAGRWATKARFCRRPTPGPLGLRRRRESTRPSSMSVS